MNLRFLLPVAATLAALPAFPLLIRADRDDAEYVELASRYGSSVRLPNSLGEGVLIAPRWILTAPGPAQLVRAIAPVPALTVGAREYAIESIFTTEDLALVLLREEVRDVVPTPVYRESDESGKGVAIVGHGPTGPMGSAGKADGKKRAALNTIDAVAATTFEARIKPGDEASDLQGALTPAEVGAAAYIVIDDGRVFVAGIARSADGKREVYTRLSARNDWIETTMWEAAKKEAKK